MSTAQPTAPIDQQRRRRKRLVGVLLAVVVLFVLPTPIARDIIESQLESLGIKHTGIDTIDIDLWNSRVRAGPMAFGAGEGQQGQISGGDLTIVLVRSLKAARW
ncbi:MAG: hypothetical protein ACI9DC_002595 [Gammaproteobacteria bacterium]|jgi:hypothetical protein